MKRATRHGLLRERRRPLITSYHLTPQGEIKTGLSATEIREVMTSGQGALWVDYERPAEEEQAQFKETYEFHPLAMADCLATHDKPKVDDYEGYLFLVIHCPDFEVFPRLVRTVELDAFLGPNYLITYHRATVRSVADIREQHSKDIAQLLGEGAEFLLHRILVLMMANYEPMLDKLRLDIERVEDRVLVGKGGDVQADILRFKKQVIYLLNVMTEQREVMNLLSHSSFDVIQQKARVYFRDIYDQLMKIQILTQNYREFVSDLRDTQMSMAANRMNEIMKTLTIIATIMMPMTLVVGIYGMNFEGMPELKWKYGYAVVWGILLAMGGGMIWYFKKKKWL